MAGLECYSLACGAVAEGRFRDPVHFFHRNLTSILSARIKTVGYIYNVIAHVFLHHIPWSSAKTEPFTLTYGVEPVSFVRSNFLSGLYFDHRSFFSAEVAFYKIRIIDFSKKAYSLRVFSGSVWEFCLSGSAPDFRFGQFTEREHYVGKLVV